MSSQEFINDMKKLFEVCAISNFGAKICQFGIMDDFSNHFIGGHINLFVHSQSICQPVPFSLTSFHFSILEQVLIPLYHGEDLRPCIGLELIGECLSSSPRRQ